MTETATPEKLCLIYITTTDRAEAVAIGRELVARRLAACANVIAPTTAIYRWEGDIHEDDEATLIIKTTHERTAEIRTVVTSLHSYELPCILVLNEISAGDAFGDWIISETQPAV